MMVLSVVMGMVLAGDVARFDPEPVPIPPTDPNVLVLRLREWRSLSSRYELAALPEFALYGGGRVIVPAPGVGELHQGRELTLSPAEYRRVYLAAHRAGLARSAQLRSPMVVTDGWSLTVTLWSGDRHHTTEVSLPGRWDTGRRQRIDSFRKYVLALAGQSTGYRAERLAVLASGGSSEEPARPWPWANLHYGADTWFGACTVLTRPTMTAVEAAARTATSATPWRSGDGEPLQLVFRPLLPHERDCDDLDHP